MKARRPGWLFDDSEIEDTFGDGQRAIDFIKALKHPKSKLPDQAFQLPKFYERIIRRVEGPRKENGNRQVKTVYILLPRGARKTSIGAAWALNNTFGTGWQVGSQNIVAASAEDQAKIAFDEAMSIVRATPWLEKKLKPTVSLLNVVHPKSSALFRTVSSDGGAQLGKTIDFALCDELIAWYGRELWDAIRTGLNKVPGSLQVIITQAGKGARGVAFERLQYARKVARGDVVNPAFLPVLFETDPDANWDDEELWHYVNPGLADGFPDLDGLREFAKEARESPAERDAFRQFHLNVWLDYSEAPFVDMNIYDEGAKPPIDLADLESSRQPVYIGVDLSTNIDLTAVVMVWGNPHDGFHVHPHFFCPKSNLDRRVRADGVPYDHWEEAGYITPTPGDVIDYRVIEDHLKELAARFNIAEMSFDPKGGHVMIADLLEAGITAHEFPQRTELLGPAAKELERAIIGRKFNHGGNPVLRWHFENIALGRDRNDNFFFHKSRSKDRIDGAVAAAMAVSRCCAAETNVSSYDTFTGNIEEWSFA